MVGNGAVGIHLDGSYTLDYNFDMNFQWRIPDTGVVANLSLFNLTDAPPPYMIRNCPSTH